jgi:hypothetical protein
MALRTTLAVSALALAAGFTNMALAQDVRSTDQQTIEHWYGRAGGLTGSERITGLTAGNRPIGITYDQEVAARTNMSIDRATGRNVGVVYDEEVATRTNMQRGTSKPVIAAQPGRQAN